MVRVVHADGIEGARAATGLAVVIDVLRAFTVSACALAAGVTECRLVGTVEEAKQLQTRIPGSAISAEIDGYPVEGVEISNSPSQVLAARLEGRTLVQRSSDGTQGALAAAAAATSQVFAASLVVASATAARVAALQPATVTLIAMGTPRGHPEDRACAEVLAALLEGRRPPDLETLLKPLKASDRYRQVRRGEWPGFSPDDLALALRLDSFEFAMPVSRDELGLKLLRL